MLNDIRERVVSRKTLMLVSSTVLFWLGATDGVVLSTEQEIITGATAVVSLIFIGLVDIVKAWRI